ncbi:MAG TPA: hypothetical protein VM778_01150 [Gemmatimonadota bacterium]|nr:hypothetical protein [Gemmatimonadota bacterium]
MSTRDATIAIIAHRDDMFSGQPRLVRLLIPRWEEMGLRVTVVTDPASACEADVAFLHVSLSLVPDAYSELAARFPRTVNGSVRDIRRRAFSRLLVDQEGPDPGRVIVKTDWNSGGWRELRGEILASTVGRWARPLQPTGRPWRWVSRLEAARPWSRRRALPVDAYPVFPSREAVPEGVWKNPNLVVERFVAEREGPLYVCRHWLFLGDREATRRTVSPDPTVKFRGAMENTAGRVPEELRRVREELGFDYGKFDYGIVDGEVVLYDVNRTPGASADARVHAETVAALSEGILEFLPSRS